MIEKQQVEEARALRDKEKAYNEKFVTDYLKTLLAIPFKLSYFNTDSYADNTSCSLGYRVSFEIELVDTFGKSIFGSDVSLKIVERKLEMNYGCCGSFVVKENYGQRNRVLVMNSIIEHADEIENLLLSLDLSKQKAFNEIWRQYKKEQDEIIKAEEAAKDSVIEKDLKIGNEFIIKDYDNKVKILSVGPKKIKFEYKIISKNHYTGADYTNTYTKQVGRDYFIYCIREKFEENYPN